VIAEATLLREPLPLLLSTRSGMSRQFGHIPAPPVALPVSAAIVPATCVPWPLPSSGAESPCTQS
jgi:hypothetical protein